MDYHGAMSLRVDERLAFIVILGTMRGGEWDYKRGVWAKKPELS
jgi:hypothetical protein